jgi:protoheme IX farnesyltransferase
MRIELQQPVSLPAALAARAADYFEMTKPRCMLLVLVTTAVGFVLACGRTADLQLLALTLLGTALCGGGSIAVNQVLERRYDRLMDRTRNRPMAAGRLSPVEGTAFALLISAIGLAVLAIFVNATTALLGAITWAGYVFLYTPLKRRTALCTLVGAVPGAIPPMMGWTAVRDSIDAPAWVLFGILFLWQIPHFLAIGRLYRADYTRAGYRMLPAAEGAGAAVQAQLFAYCLALIWLSLTPKLMGFAGTVYFAGALVLGVFLAVAARGAGLSASPQPARRLLTAGSIDLAALLCLLVFDRVQV